MFGNDEFVRLFGSVPAGDDEKLIQIVSAAVREGIAIVLDKPGTKVPMCTLTAKQRNEADAAARSAAAATGDERWDKRVHACGLDHALTVASLTGTPEQPEGDQAKVRAKVSALIRRLTKAHGAQPNIGVELGLSNLLVVDVDTPDERQGFVNDWGFALYGDTRGPDNNAEWPGLTVKSPGVMKLTENGEENWVHKDGGHYWFTLPDGVTLPAGTGTTKAESGWVAMWDRHQVLVPPSTRPEGAYEIIGQISQAPAWLVEYVIANAKARIERAVSAGPLPDGTGDIDRWAAGFTWGDFLIPDGWTDTGLPDRCSCPIWTAPGDHGSPKSATAHEVGCDRYDTSPGHAPLHIWTDNPPEFLRGVSTVTVPQYVARRDHDGDTSAMLKAVGINRNPGNGLSDFVVPPKLSVVPDFDQPGTELTDESPSEAEVGATEPEQDDDSWKPIDLSILGEEDEIGPELMPRSDGQISFLYKGLIHSFHGESESGKSWVLQSEVVRVIQSGEHVLFLDFENDAKAVFRRFQALGASREDMKLIDYRNPDSKPDFAGKWWQNMFTSKYALIVLDGVTDALGIFALGTKDNDEVSMFLRKFPRALARRTGAAVAVIDHVVKSQDGRGRFAIGGQAKMAGLDGAAYVVDVVEPLGRGLKGELRIQVGKDKPGWVRGVAQGYSKDRLGDVARFCMDATDPKNITWELKPPAQPFDVSETVQVFDPELELKLLRVLALSEEGYPSQKKLITALGPGHRPDTVMKAIEHLVDDGRIDRGDADGRGARVHRISSLGAESVA